MIKSSDIDSMEEAIDRSLSQDPLDTSSINQLGKIDPQVNLGLSDDALNEAIEYMAGAASTPKYMETFSNEKLKNFTTVATVAQVSRVPGLIKLLNETNSHLFASRELQTMDMNDLSKLSRTLSEEIRLILDSARKTLDTLDKLDAPVSPNQQLIEQLLQMPDEDIMAMKEFMANKRSAG